MTSCLGPTMALSQFLTSLLQPIYDQITASTTFSRGVDAIKTVDLYVNKNLLRPTTFFATFHVDDICTIFPHKQTIHFVERFLRDYVPEQRIQNITVETLIILVKMFLNQQYFLYNNQIYRQIKGSGSGSSLTTILININMFYRQQDLVNILLNKNELFGRYVRFV